MKHTFLTVLSALLVSAVACGGDSSSVFQESKPFSAKNQIDALMQAGWGKAGLKPSAPCSDAVFLRRVSLDLAGRLPPAPMVQRFLKHKNPEKRARVIDELLKSDDFALYRSLRWCDILRVKSEFPIKLWPNGVQAYHRWILESLRKNLPFDQFARELLTRSGSNFRVPPVNFYRAVSDPKPETLARAAALTFMGCRTENWSEDQQKNLAQFFSLLTFKPTSEWKEEIVQFNHQEARAFTGTFPDGTTAEIQAGEDPRIAFAAWLTAPKNPWFRRAIVNRIWSRLFGSGLIHPVDDIRPDSAVLHPQVLAYLEEELLKSKYDLKHIYRLILNSATYQQSSVAADQPAEREKHFAVFPVRRLQAEVLIDNLCLISGTQERYSSPIPEPFTFIPNHDRTIGLADGSITSSFLELFGRPSRDTGLEAERVNHPTRAQSMHMLNSSHIQKKITNGWRFKQLLKSMKSKKKHGASLDMIYLTILSRYPTAEEKKTVQAYAKDTMMHLREAGADLIWALINSKEFLYQH